ncbi:MAG: response regulator [Bryobacteraceae bacterium]
MERSEFEQWKGREVARLLSLVETERRYYQEMVAGLPIALAVLSPDRSVASANRAFRQLFGLSIDDVRKKTIEQVLPSDLLIEKIRDLNVHGLGRTPFLIDANEKSYRVGLVPIRNWSDDMEPETLLVVEDISDLRVAAEPRPELQVPGRIPVADLDNLPAIIWQANAATLEFSAVGGGAEALLGYTHNHWTQAPSFFANRISPEDREGVLALYRSALERGGEASAEFRAISASGQILWCRETILAPEPGTGNGLCGVLTAISQRKRAEDLRIVAERHAALTHVSGRLAHDLNNPLMIVTGYTEEMQHSFEAGDPRRADMEQIMTATQRISDLTNQLLHFTRSSASPASIIDLPKVLTAIEKRLALAADAPIAIFRSENVVARANAEQLEQALTALLSANRENRTRVRIKCDTATVAEAIEGATLEPGDYARITLDDNGTQLTPAKQATLFESFFNKDPQKTEGVALAYAYSNIREWGGDIAVECPADSGVRFTIYLPCAGPAAVAAMDSASSATVEEEPPAELVAMETEVALASILVVDDEPGIRALVAKILRREKFHVVEAGSVEEALTTLRETKKPADLLVTDVMLADQSGRELAEQASQLVPGIKVLYISGFTDDESVRTGDFPPGSKFLQKPFTLGALVGRVREALES